MSMCISHQGEYGAHVLGKSPASQFTCQRCFAFDEDAAIARVVTVEAKLTAIHDAVVGGYAAGESHRDVVKRIHEILTHSTAEAPPAPACSDFVWVARVGQTFPACDSCGRSYWEHEADGGLIPNELRAAMRKLGEPNV